MLPEVQWLVGRGITTNPDLVSGLYTDHTTMDGLYAYVDFTSNASVPGEFLFYTTPLCFPKVIKCQSCYHVVGKSKQYSQFVYSTTLAVTLLQMCQHNCKVKWCHLKDPLASPSGTSNTERVNCLEYSESSWWVIGLMKLFMCGNNSFDNLDVALMVRHTTDKIVMSLSWQIGKMWFLQVIVPWLTHPYCRCNIQYLYT